MSACIALNEQKNGIEVRFDSKPLPEIIESLKQFGFRWSGKQKMWFAKQTQERISFVNSLNYDVSFALPLKNKQEKNGIYDLWEMTRTEKIKDNYALYKIQDTKEIAKIIRKHIKPRFPMCKFSVTSDYNSIDIDLLSSPFNKDGEELKAIIHYVYKFADSYNYNNSDSMSDYFDVNFYGVYESSILSYRYEKLDNYDSLDEIVALFKSKKDEFEKAEALRKETEFQRAMEQAEINRKIAEEQERQLEEDRKYIEKVAEVTDLDKPYYILNMCSLYSNKLSDIDEVNSEIEEGNFKKETCEITRKVNLPVDAYEKFIKMFLTHFSFLAGKGGTSTLDNRINSTVDYSEMDEEERKTVEFYASDCVAVYCENELKLVCNPEGFEYSRYVLIPSNDYKRTDSYTINQVVSEQEMKENYKIFERLYDKSTTLIIENDLSNSWNEKEFSKWRKLMVEFITSNGIELNINVIRAIPSDAYEFKVAMYKLFKEPEDIASQFRNYDFKDGQHITVFKMDEWLGGLHSYKLTFKRYERTNWGGKNGIELFGKLANKRNECSLILNDRILVVEDWVDLPDELFWEESYSSTGLLCKKGRYLSFDDKQIDAVLSYLKQIKVKPIVNTYKPQF